MIKIDYYNQTRAVIDPKIYLQTIQTVLSKYGITDNVEVELRIVGSDAMQRLNREHRARDYATDVLSFPIWPSLEAIKAQNGQVLLGSIVVCLPIAIRDAKQVAQPVEAKIAFLIEHSLLHLMGFHHAGDR